MVVVLVLNTSRAKRHATLAKRYIRLIPTYRRSLPPFRGTGYDGRLQGITVRHSWVAISNMACDKMSLSLPLSLPPLHIHKSCCVCTYTAALVYIIPFLCIVKFSFLVLYIRDTYIINNEKTNCTQDWNGIWF